MQALIILGSNVDREANLRQAVTLLQHWPFIALQAISPIYESAAVGDPAQAPYWNAAGLIETGLPPLFLKENLRLIEAALGRVRGAGASPGQIPIDLDLVLYGQSMVDLGRRDIPDPAIYHDPHVALPLADLAPDWVHPESGETLAEIAQQLNFSDKRFTK